MVPHVLSFPPLPARTTARICLRESEQVSLFPRHSQLFYILKESLHKGQHLHSDSYPLGTRQGMLLLCYTSCWSYNVCHKARLALPFPQNTKLPVRQLEKWTPTVNSPLWYTPYLHFPSLKEVDKNKDKPYFQRSVHFFMRMTSSISIRCWQCSFPATPRLTHWIQTRYVWGNSPFHVQHWLPKTIFSSPTLCTWTNILREVLIEVFLVENVVSLIQNIFHCKCPSTMSAPWMTTDYWKLTPSTHL